MASPLPSLATAELFGGAFSMLMPESFTDISQYRPIPDHQEVYIQPQRDQSIIVELNAYQEVPNDQAARLHWDDLLKDGGSSGHEISRIGSLDLQTVPGVAPHVDYIAWIDGTQTVAKYREEGAANTVRTYICDLRMKEAKTDILIIFNFPTQVHQNSSTARLLEKENHESPAVMTDEQVNAIIHQVISSFTIKTMSIFPEYQ